MVAVNRKSKYVLEYIANTGPLKKARELQEKFNASVKRGDAILKLIAQTSKNSFSGVVNNIRSTINAAKRLSRSFSGAMRSMRNAMVNTRFEIATLGAALATIFGKFVSDGVKTAADTEEILNRFRVSFQGVIGEATKVVDEMSASMRLSRNTVADYLSQAQDVLTGFGYSRVAALGLSKQITQLSLDLASFNNIPFDEALKNMLSGLLGNHNALRGMRVVLREATLEQKALSMGIKKGWNNLDEATKLQIRFRVAVDQSVNAIGDLHRTMFETTNRFRFFQEMVKNMKNNLFPGLTIWLGEIAEQLGVYILNNETMFSDLGAYITHIGYVLSNVTRNVLAFIDQWRDLTDIQQKIIIFTGAVAGIATPIMGILVIFGRALRVMSFWTAVIVLVALALQDVYAVMKGGNGYFRDLLNYFGTSVTEIGKFIENFISMSKAFVSGVKNSQGFQTVLAAIADIFKRLWSVITKDIVPALALLWKTLSANEIIQTVFQLLYSGLKVFLDIVGLVFSIFSGNLGRIQEHANSFVESLKEVLGGAFKLLIGVVGSILTNLLPNLIRGIFGFLVSVMVQVLKLIIQGIVAIMSPIVKGVVFVLSFLWNVFKTFVINTKDMIKTIFMVLVDATTGTLKAAFSFLERKVTWVIDKMQKAKAFITGNPTDPGGSGSPGGPGGVPDPGTPRGPLPPDLDAGAIVGNTTNNGGSTTITFSEVNIPIQLPDDFQGNAEEFRKIAAEESQAAIAGALLQAYDNNRR